MILGRSAFLRAMRGVAHSVAVVTTDGAAGRHGATVTSFCSVSADPPTMLVCLRAGSRIALAVGANGVFCINVLDTAATVLADRFAGRTDAAPGDRFDAVELLPSPDAPPVLAAAVSAFRCRLVDTIASGSHLISVGLVLDAHTAERAPLAYLDGCYASVGRHTPSPGR